MLSPDALTAAVLPTFYFIGVSTRQSAIMRIFPRWAEHLKLGDCRLRGIDLPPAAPAEDYRRVVEFLKHDPLSLGALITTHKIGVFQAAAELFDAVDPQARLLGETSCIYKRAGRFCCAAKDVESSGLAMRAFVPPGHWRDGAELLCLGAGGAGLAISWYWLMPERGGDRPARIEISDIAPERLAATRQIHAQLEPELPIAYTLTSPGQTADPLLHGLPPGSLVINATGLGKDAPGSPLSDAALFPDRGLVWELNYRGERPFLAQARAQQQTRRLHVEEGWHYFIFGWTRVIAEVFDIAIPTDPDHPTLAALTALAAEV